MWFTNAFVLAASMSMVYPLPDRNLQLTVIKALFLTVFSVAIVKSLPVVIILGKAMNVRNQDLFCFSWNSSPVRVGQEPTPSTSDVEHNGEDFRNLNYGEVDEENKKIIVEVGDIITPNQRMQCKVDDYKVVGRGDKKDVDSEDSGDDDDDDEEEEETEELEEEEEEEENDDVDDDHEEGEDKEKHEYVSDNVVDHHCRGGQGVDDHLKCVSDYNGYYDNEFKYAIDLNDDYHSDGGEESSTKSYSYIVLLNILCGK